MLAGRSYWLDHTSIAGFDNPRPFLSLILGVKWLSKRSARREPPQAFDPWRDNRSQCFTGAKTWMRLLLASTTYT
jgi:hypothetical protein